MPLAFCGACWAMILNRLHIWKLSLLLSIPYLDFLAYLRFAAWLVACVGTCYHFPFLIQLWEVCCPHTCRNVFFFVPSSSCQCISFQILLYSNLTPSRISQFTTKQNLFGNVVVGVSSLESSHTPTPLSLILEGSPCQAGQEGGLLDVRWKWLKQHHLKKKQPKIKVFEKHKLHTSQIGL